MSDEAVESIRVEAPPARCYAVAIDFDRYTDWATDVKECEVLRHDGRGRGTRVRFAIAALGQSIGYVLDYDYGAAPAGFSWRLVEGSMVRVLDGSYRFDPVDGGTEVGYRLVVDLSIPMPGFMKRRAAGMIVQNALKQFKGFVEAGV